MPNSMSTTNAVAYTKMLTNVARNSARLLRRTTFAATATAHTPIHGVTTRTIQIPYRSMRRLFASQ